MRELFQGQRFNLSRLKVGSVISAAKLFKNRLKIKMLLESVFLLQFLAKVRFWECIVGVN